MSNVFRPGMLWNKALEEEITLILEHEEQAKIGFIINMNNNGKKMLSFNSSDW